MSKKVAVIMGSDSDLPVVSKAIDMLKQFDIPTEVHVYSAHRTPKEAAEFAANARENGFGVIIAAAGTGGHINPGIAIANKIMQEEPDSKIIFIGTNRGLEVDLVKRAGYELKTIDAYGISRSFTTQNIKRVDCV